MNDSTDETASDQTDRPTALARVLRETRGHMLQVDFARLVERPQSVISNWERSTKTPNLETLADVEGRLGLPLGHLAARAGYFTSEAVGGLPEEIVATMVCASLAEAAEAVAAADVLGLGSRMDSTVVDGVRSWNVAVAR